MIQKPQQHPQFLRVQKDNILTKRAANVLLQMIHKKCIDILDPSVVSQLPCPEKDQLYTTHRIINCALSLEELLRARSKACSILKDASHPAHHLFQLLPSGRQYRTLKVKTNNRKTAGILVLLQ